MTINQIQILTEALASALVNIQTIITERERKIAAIEREYDERLRPHAAAFTGRHAALKTAIKSAPDLFKRPRSRVFAGIEVGYRKKKGTIVIQDEPATIEKMIKLLGEKDAVQYLNVVTTVSKKAVESMPGDIMKKLGIELKADTDAVVIKLEQSALEKQIAALMAEKSEPNQEAA
jgi:hypothetical protein